MPMQIYGLKSLISKINLTFFNACDIYIAYSIVQTKYIY